MKNVSHAVATHFTFTGERTQIVYDTHIPGPLRPGEDPSGGQLLYQGVEGELTFRGKDITAQESVMGTLLTVVLQPNNDRGALSFTLLLPQVTISHGGPVPFQTLGIKTASRGFIQAEGPVTTFSLFPLLGTAQTGVTPQ